MTSRLRGLRAALLGILPLALAACAQASADPHPAMMRTGGPPWPAPADPVAHAEAAGLAMFTSRPKNARTSTVHLRVLIDGRPVTVPARLGVAEHGLVAEVSTTDTSGALRLVRAGPDPLTLGQVFVLWGVRLDERCVGGSCATGPEGVRVYVDGRPAAAAPVDVELRDGERLVVSLDSAPPSSPSGPSATTVPKPGPPSPAASSRPSAPVRPGRSAPLSQGGCPSRFATLAG